MEMYILREDVALEKMAAAGRSEAVAEGSLPLPGGLREEARVLYAGASATVERAEAAQDRLTVTGKVLFRALYTQGDPQQPRALEATADYTHVMELPGATARCRAMAWTQVGQVTASIYGGQMNLRAVMEVQGRAMLEREAQAVTGLTGLDALETCPQQLTVQRTAASGTADALIREELELPTGLGVTDTLFATADARVDEVTGGAGRAGVAGKLRLEVWHAAAGGAPLTVTRHVIPFEQAVDLNGLCGDELRADVSVMDVAVASQPAGDDERILRAEIRLRLTVEAVKQETLTVLKDAYTTSGDALLLTREAAAWRTGSADERADENLRTVLLLPERAPALRQILAAFVTPVLTSCQCANGRTVAEGSLQATIIGLSREDDALTAVTAETPFRQTFDADAGENGMVALTVTDAEARPIAPDRAELRCSLSLRSRSLQTASADLVTDAARAPAADPGRGVVLCYAQPGDTLWNLARRYRVPQAQLTRINPELAEPLSVGQAVVIWRRGEG